MEGEFRDKAEQIRKRSAEKRARGEYPPDPKEVARDKAQKYIAAAEELVAMGAVGNAAWVTAYATLALATLALANATTPTPGSEYL